MTTSMKPISEIKIGGFSIGHLLVQAEKELERKTNETPIFSNQAERRIPMFDNAELSLGKILGKGGFCKVLEVVKVTLKDGVAAKASKERQSHPGELKSGSILQDRDFMHQYFLRDGKDYRYAIKVLKDEAFQDVPTFINGVVDLAIEARFLSVIRHPNIIKMRAFSSNSLCSPNFFIVFDRLYDILSKRLVTWAKRKQSGIRKIMDLNGKKASMFWAERIAVAYDLANALTHLHSLRIVYRDLKPDNIGFDVRGDVKIFDFGLSRQLPKEKDADGNYKMTMDTGSPRYMAPEVALGKPYNETADVYSFAILLHQICSLETPFQGLTAKSLEKMVTSTGHRPKCDPKWHPRILRLLNRGWHMEISKRPAMEEVLDILQSELAEHASDPEQLMHDVSDKTMRSIHRLKNGSSRFKLKTFEDDSSRAKHDSTLDESSKAIRESLKDGSMIERLGNLKIESSKCRVR